jgi:hypothetical protein
MPKFKALVKKVDFKKSYGDNIVTVVLEPCYIEDPKIISELVKTQQAEDCVLDVSIVNNNGEQ